MPSRQPTLGRLNSAASCLNIRPHYSAGITVAAGQLQKAGFIRYERGRIEVTDGPGLESVACECHGMARRASDRLLNPEQAKRDVYRP